MEQKQAEFEKTYLAEKLIATVRAFIIVFGTATFFLIKNPSINYPLAYILLALIWVYGAFVLIAKPYQRFPLFLASWFTYLSDSLFLTLWIYATGGFYSAFKVLLYTSIMAVAFRFNLRTTMFTSVLYAACYVALTIYMKQWEGHVGEILTQAGFIFLIGYFANHITQETLLQTKEKLLLKKLMRESEESRKKLEDNRLQLQSLNDQLQLQNNIFQHAEKNAKLGSYSWNIDTGKVVYSDNMFRLLDTEPGEFEPSPEKFFSFVHPEDQAMSEQRASTAIRKKEVETSVRRIISATGVLKHFRTTGQFVETGNEKLLIGTVQDVSVDVQLQEEINSKNAELQHNNNELSSFNYIASHDLQEPVRKIHTFSNMIMQKEKETLSPSARDYLERINTSAARMQRLIEAFSNYSRIGSNKLVFEPTDLNQILSDARQVLADQIAESGAEINATALPVLNVAPFHMHQLFENLLGNAIKYRKKDSSPRITVSASKIKGENVIPTLPSAEYWEISVSDNGIGFDPQYSERIFEVFQRLHSKDQYPGTGIGLAICKKIALIHRGNITATSVPGEGTTFRVYLPA